MSTTSLRRFGKSLLGISDNGGCHGAVPEDLTGLKKLAIVGSPNVGKSVMFNRLTGVYVTVSNYPGTTVEVARGRGTIGGEIFEVIDTPGMYSLLPITEEEEVARHLLLSEQPCIVLHMIDAKNLSRMLPMTLQLIEAGFPVILVLNMIDEAERAGITIDDRQLEKILDIPVVATVATAGQGMDRLMQRIVERLHVERSNVPTFYPSQIDENVNEVCWQIENLLTGNYTVSKRTISLLLLQHDPEITDLVKVAEDGAYDRIHAILAGQAVSGEDATYRLTIQRQETARQIVESTVTALPESRCGKAEKLSRLCMEPGYGFFTLFALLFAFDSLIGPLLRIGTVGSFMEGMFTGILGPAVDRLVGGWVSSATLRAMLTGESGVLTFFAHLLTVVLPEITLISTVAVLLFLPVEAISRHRIRRGYGLFILFNVLYIGLYQFVGLFGAGSLVDVIETSIFETHVNPVVTKIVEAIVPWTVLRSLFIGEYGIFTLGVRYAVALILPIVGTFFIAFSVLEDTGYFPRLAMLVDRGFKRIGLSGRAVIPMVLGLGCDTMATMVTRILETRRERLISTLLLALAIPCSAQLGVILALLSSSPGGVLLWVGVVIGELLLIGCLAAKLLPGETPSFYMELPPLRKPRLINVLTKTYSRMQWYLMEILPLFVVASVLIWVGTITGLFQIVVGWLTPVVRLLGLPDQAAVAFLFGFFRRDYGAAGLFDMHRAGVLTETQMVVAAVTLTLFLPCIAQFLIMKKERGLRATVMISGFITVMAFMTGWALNTVLRWVL